MARLWGRAGSGPLFGDRWEARGLGESEARTLSVLVGWRGGSGMELTIVAWMVVDGVELSPQELPLV